MAQTSNSKLYRAIAAVSRSVDGVRSCYVLRYRVFGSNSCSGPASRLQPGLDGFEEPEAHCAVITCERDHEAHTPMLRSVGIARQGADAGKGASLEVGAVAAAEQGGMGCGGESVRLMY